ncbi:hypothetical protein GE09DRAFT_1060150 [Coniochaeta sp. 2T2.1]|nr:hypothetical protein GE09DRAFT_1060150 [Coniochaeta sp. 2T2.1]
MGSSTKPTSGLATPPLPSAKPLVYITGSSTSTKQTVAEYSALLLGDEAILIDQPYTSTMTPPPPSSTPPNDGTDSSFSRHKRPKGLRLPSSSTSTSTSTNTTFSSSSKSAQNPASSSSRSRSSSTTAATAAPSLTTPYFDPLLTTLASNPLRTAILTDTKRRLSSSSSYPSSSSSTPAIHPCTAAAQTGRPFLLVRLGAAAHSPYMGQQQQPAGAMAATLVLSEDTTPDPHAAALRIVEFVREVNARRRSHGDWEGVNEGLRGGDEETQGMGGAAGTGTGTGRKTRADSCVCGVITPVLTPAEEREMRF